MVSLKEFLASQEAPLRSEQAARDEAKKRWIIAVRSLLDQISTWIKESDPHQLVKLNRGLLGEIDEHGGLRKLDDLENMRIIIGDQEVLLRPAEKEGLGPQWKPGEGKWAGRIDMIGYPYGFEIYRFIFANYTETWHLQSTKDYRMTLLNQANFDAALVSLFA